MQFELYKDQSSEFRWRLLADNGRIIADSGEGYTTKQNAEHGISLVQSSALASTEDLT